jgi:hypothetical protein
MTRLQISQLCQNNQSPFRATITPHQPPRRIRQPNRQHQNTNRKLTLKQEWKAPLERAVDELHAIINLIRQHQPKQHIRQLTTNLPPPMCRRADLTLINRRDAGDIPNADTSDDPRDHKLHPFNRTAHQHRVDNHHNSGA